MIGNADNEVLPTHPLYNIPPKAVWKSYYHFKENYGDMYNEKSEHCGDRRSSSNNTTDERSFNRSSTSVSQMSGTDDADDELRKDDDSMITDDDGISVSTSTS